MPNSAPSISAATSKMMEIAKLIRKPDRMPGIAPGRTIFRTIEVQLRPKLWPIRISVRSTLSTAPYVATTVGVKLPNAISAYLDPSPMPNQITNNGSKAILGMGKIAAITGTKPDRIYENKPISVPMVTPRLIPIKDPRIRREIDGTKCLNSKPE